MSLSLADRQQQFADNAAATGQQNRVLHSDLAAVLGDPKAIASEQQRTSDLLQQGCQVVVLRLGHRLPDAFSSQHRWRRWRGMMAGLYPLLTRAFRSCYVTEDEVAAAEATAAQLNTGRRPSRVVTLLGRNRPLAEVWQQRHSQQPVTWLVIAIAWLLSWLGVGHLAAFLFGWLAKSRPTWQVWQLATLRPQSPAELISLCHAINQPYIALAGYNTGVVHFGWKHPGRTVVQTIESGRTIRLSGERLIADAGCTLRQALHLLNEHQREFFALPNYSYVSAGTVMMVPVHGSGSEVSTLGDTITRVLYFDPQQDRLVLARRGTPAFDDVMYHPKRGVVVLRVHFRVRPQTAYRLEEETLHNPAAADVWKVLAEPTADNTEIRKSKAASEEIHVKRFFKIEPVRQEGELTQAKDQLGRLWDRLEENRLTAWLFHTFVRVCGFHVELFLDEASFQKFWEAHRDLPLAKIQLRFVHADHLPHSPIGDRDRISADLFMPRRKSSQFLTFVRENLPDARHNPGKHSM